MLTFSCPACKKTLQVKDEHAGKQVKCGGCGTVAVAPSASAVHTSLLAGAPSRTDANASSPAAAAAPDPLSLHRAPTVDFQKGATSPSCDGTKVYDPGLTQFLAPALADDELGRLGKYRILSVIGRGGMGVVYKAEDSLLRRVVALKAILPTLGTNVEVHKRFLREARAMAAVEHEHIVRLYEVNEDRGVPYIAMELLVGESLAARLSRHGPVPLSEAIHIGREIAEGLAAAHARGLIHRDIKPANIFLQGSRNERREARGDRAKGSPLGLRLSSLVPRVKILDFGLTRAAEEDTRLTQSGDVLGTPAYMSPEQSRGEIVDFRSDLFSLGVVLYRMCTDSEPFAGPDGISTMMAIATEAPTPPQVRNLDVPADLSNLIMQLLEKDPAKRCGSAQEVADALAQIERGEAAPVITKPVVPAAAVSTVTPPQRKDSKQIYWVIIAAVVVACGCVASALLMAVIALLR
jgi:serine/threonine protein kinase